MTFPRLFLVAMVAAMTLVGGRSPALAQAEPKGFTPESVESVTARCHPHPATASGGTCGRLKLLRVLTLGAAYVPRALPLRPQPEASLAAGETKTFRLTPSAP